jgi:hypothetical protein
LLQQDSRKDAPGSLHYVGVVTAQVGSTNADVKNPELGFLVAFLAGFSERFTIKTIDRFMTVLTVGEDPKKASSAPPPKSAVAPAKP